MALNEGATTDVIEYLGKQIESFFFYSVSLGIQAKNNENQFTRWAIKLRNKNTVDEVAEVIEQNMVPYIKERLGEFLVKFPTLTHYHYSPLYRERYILGMIENTILSKSNFPIKGKDYLYNLQLEHILPQTPKNEVLTEEFESKHDYSSYVYRLGNVTLLESTINQAVNNFNDLNSDWFEKKQNEYKNSGIISTQLLDDEFQIGANTALNRFKNDYGFEFKKWDKESINQRQEKLLNLVFETWKFNNKPINHNEKSN
ncbi:HNH endonuclease family protein [Chryseobacterium sp. Leaf394]|uniref:HNH endonuclease family protein n=1 Tax=Chryseobacterium sp. Leaf394 TaxID=1736361 RepID=UPI000A9C7612|nr:HNH endonuclease family protein [Chryseobacterium sp. Leaf394]